MRSLSRPSRFAAAIVVASLVASPSLSEVTPTPPFRTHVDMKTFMEHVLQPAASLIWTVNGVMIDEKGEHDLGPKSDDDWEKLVSGAPRSPRQPTR